MEWLRRRAAPLSEKVWKEIDSFFRELNARAGHQRA